jgi:hypothetical protein
MTIRGVIRGAPGAAGAPAAGAGKG